MHPLPPLPRFSRLFIRMGAVWLLLMLAAVQLPAQSTVSRTLVYRQITNFASTQGFNNGGVGGLQSPIISRNGARIAFARAPGAGSATNPNRIFLINSDGTGEQQVDSYTSLVFSGSIFDISDDGTKVVSSDSVQLRISDANGARALVAFDSNELNGLKISGDGTKVFFRLGRDTSIRGSSPAILIPRGLWTINADGTGLRQIVGVPQIAAVLGVPATEVSFFQALFGVDASASGARIIFGTLVSPQAGGEGQGLFSVNLDGTGLRNLLGRVSFLQQGAISADGTKIGYNIFSNAISQTELGVINFDGSGRLKLTDNTVEHGGTGRGLSDSSDRLQLSSDGSQLLTGSNGLLYRTDGTAALQLNATVPDDGNLGLFQLLSGALPRATMNANATRFLYIFNNASQMSILDLNPASLGGAPAIANPALNPAFILLNGGSSATATASVSPVNPIFVILRYFINGFEDLSFSRSNENDFRRLRDNGQTGDATAGDGIFTNNAVNSSTAIPGTRTPRMIAGLRAADGRFQATAVEFAPFSIAAQSPTGVVTQPTITITSPPANIKVVSGAPASLAASVDDPSNFLKEVRFFLNGTQVFATASSGPFVLNTNAPLIPGTYTLMATVIDKQDRQNSSTRVVTVVPPDASNPPPDTAVLTALDGRIIAAGSTITVSATASSLFPGEALARVDFYADGVIFASFNGAGGPFTQSQSPTASQPTRRESADPLPDGTVFQAKYTLPGTSKLISLFTVALSKLGVSQVSRPVTIQSVANAADRPPSAALSGLRDRQRVRAGVKFPITLTVSDPDPVAGARAERRVFESSGVISRIEYFVNQIKVRDDANAPFGFDFTPPSDGTYVLSAVATDGAGLAAVSDPITVSTGPTVSLSVGGDGLGIEGGKRAKVIFTRSGGNMNSDLTVFYRVRGTGKNDVESLPGSAVILAGSDRFKLKIRAIDDAIRQGTRKVNIQLLESPTDDYGLGDVIKAKTLLLDND